MKKFLKFFKHYGLFILAAAVSVGTIVSIPFIFASGLGTVTASFVSVGVFFGGMSISCLIAIVQHSLNAFSEIKQEDVQGKYIPLTKDNMTNEDLEQLAILRAMEEKRLEKQEQRRQKKMKNKLENNDDYTL